MYTYFIQGLEKLFIVTVLVLYAGAPLMHFRAGEMDNIEGDSLFQLIYFGVYFVTLFLVLSRIRQIVRIAFVDKLVLLVVGFAVLTTFWSYAPDLTLRRGVALVGTTLFGVYLVSRFSLDRLLHYLGYACLLMIVFSLFFGLFLPQYGIMQQDFPGAWQGAFTHKNQLGRMMAFSLVILFIVRYQRPWLRALALFGRLAALVLIFLSTSATALVVTGSMIAALSLSRLLRWKSTLALAACFSISAFGGLGLLYAWENGDVILAGIGRDGTFSGRTELWAASLEAARAQLWLGHGYSAFWLGGGGESGQIWSSVGWQPPTAHNGWVDLMLELGLVGTLLFTMMLLLAFYRAILWVRLNPSPHAYWPLVFLSLLVMLHLTESGLLGGNNIFWAVQVAVTIGLASESAALKRRRHSLQRAPRAVGSAQRSVRSG